MGFEKDRNQIRLNDLCKNITAAVEHYRDGSILCRDRLSDIEFPFDLGEVRHFFVLLPPGKLIFLVYQIFSLKIEQYLNYDS